jgi:hypothetical protein
MDDEHGNGMIQQLSEAKTLNPKSETKRQEK